MTHHRGSFAPRRWGIAIAVLALTCGATRVAAADPILPPGEASPDNVTYEFRFDELSSKFGQTWPSFSIALAFPSWVQTLGVHRTPAPIPTPYGFDVNYVYTNSLGFFGFTSDARASITGNSFTWYYGAGFLFSPTPSAVNYFRQPGTYSGTVYGHAPFAIGSATLSIMGTPEPPAPVPEPTSILLAASGVSLLILKYRQRGRKKPRS
jgi:hypothetical protein